MLLAKTHEAVKRDMKGLMAAKGKKHEEELTKAIARATVKQAVKEVAIAHH